MKHLKLGVIAMLWPFFIFADTQTGKNSNIIKIAIFDTGFCPSKFLKHNELQYAPVTDTTNSIIDHCNQDHRKRFHGHSVLDTFIKDIKDHLVHSKKIIKVYPFIVFNKKGQIHKSYLENAMQAAKNNKIDYILLAAGLQINESKTETSPNFNDFPIPMFISTGQSPKKIKLWPQSIASKYSHVYMIGNFKSRVSKDLKSTSYFIPRDQLYVKNADFFIFDPGFEFGGSSYAVAMGLSKVIKACHHRYKNLQKCIISNLTNSKLPNIKTFK